MQLQDNNSNTLQHNNAITYKLLHNNSNKQHKKDHIH